MNFNFLNKNNNLKVQREEFIRSSAVKREVEILPCKKFVAVQEKLSKNYVLALSDTETIEATQVANPNDIEFYEGYELTPQFTDSVRRGAVDICVQIVAGLNKLIVIASNTSARFFVDNNMILNNVKIELSVANKIMINIFKHLTMTDNEPKLNNDEISYKVRSKELKNLVAEIINSITKLKEKLLIEYINRQLDIILAKFYAMLFVADAIE